MTSLDRLRRLNSRQTTVLTHYGRKSHKPYQVTIWFVVDGDRVYLGTASVKRNWVKNVQADPRIRLRVGDENFDATARFLTGAEHERAMRAIRRKYWTVSPIINFGRLLCAVGILQDNSGSFEITLNS